MRRARSRPPDLGALALPFRLNHVNVYLIADGDGWTLVDTGIGNEPTIAAWTALLEGPLKGFRITRLIVTHAHPDHVGLAGWIVERFGCALHMSQVEYLQSAYHQHRGSPERNLAQRLFFRRHGMDEEITELLLGRGMDYLKRVSILPASYRRLSKGDEIAIGARRFKVITGGGHALDQVMLYCEADNIVLSADQVLSKISPNVSVWAVEPDADSLGEYSSRWRACNAARRRPVRRARVPFYGSRSASASLPTITRRCGCRRSLRPRETSAHWCRCVPQHVWTRTNASRPAS